MDKKTFQKLVWDFYKKNKRSFPWRSTTDPYKILVSEIMLQQTQAPRVVSKFNEFIKKFPNIKKLANAKQSGVLKLWQGLGYNRRALNLQKAVKVILEKHKGKVPNDFEKLVALPAIGPYTAHAIRAFAFDISGIVIETNIRAVYAHYFFPKQKTKLSDSALLPVIQKMTPSKKAREWNAALMDLGAKLKTEGKGSPARHKVYTKQPTFKGSFRALRGAILRESLKSNFILKNFSMKGYTKTQITKAVSDLKKEGFTI